MVTDLQKSTAQAIVNIFETGKALGDYGTVTLLAGDSGHLTYGRSQTTLASGNLFLLIKAYCAAPEAEFSQTLAPFLGRLEDHDLSLDHDGVFRDLLRRAGDDTVMHDVQDGFFDRVYWQPAVASAQHIGSETALGQAVIYDSKIHGSWHRMRDRINENNGSLNDLGEQDWIVKYIQTRFDWLSNHSNKLLGKTVYRMKALQKLCDDNDWTLDLPLTVRGVLIDEPILSGIIVRASAGVADERILRLRNPMMQGEDVREVQEALKTKGVEVDVDGVFGSGTKAAVISFQQANNLEADGIVGSSTRAALGIGL